MTAPRAAPAFRSDFEPRYGEVERVAPGIRRILAHNPSKYSAWGTGTYFIGGDLAGGGPGGPVAVIDPGPDLDSHHRALDAALEGEEVAAILVTHTHADHSPASARLAELTGAIRYGYGPHPAAAIPAARDEAEPDEDGADEESGSYDAEFVPDVTLRDGDVIGADMHSGADWRFEAIHTPGHISNHLCFAETTRNVLFSGDHVMGWSTTVISPPDGRIDDYLRSLRLLLDRDERTYYPTHGPAITDPVPFVRSLLDHRLEREREILALIQRNGTRSIDELVAEMYASVRPELHAPAARSVEAHLIKLLDDAVVELIDDRFRLSAQRSPSV